MSINRKSFGSKFRSAENRTRASESRTPRTATILRSDILMWGRAPRTAVILQPTQ